MTTSLFSASFEHLHLLKHPFYNAWMQGTLKVETLQDYAKQYYYHVDRFPRYISAIHSLCEDTGQRRELLDNLNEEEGIAYGVSHPDLWLNFAEGLGVSKKDVLAASPGKAIEKVVEIFFHYSRRSYHEGLGALYAYESQVPEIAESKLEGLQARYGIEDKKTLAFFEVHRTADIAHRSVIEAMLAALPDQQKQEAMAAAHAAASALWDFLTEMNGLQQRYMETKMESQLNA